MLKTLVSEAVKDNGYPTAGDTELVAHVRTGDVLKPKIKRGVGLGAKEYFSDLFSKINIKRYAIDTFTVVTAMHYGNFKRMQRYRHTEESEAEGYLLLELIKNQVLEQGLKFKLISSEDTDQDFAYLTSANYFLEPFAKVNSGFSRLVLSCLSEDATIIKFKSRGLGDTIEKVTNKIGVRKCGGCGRRQKKLNKLFPYKDKDKKKS